MSCCDGTSSIPSYVIGDTLNFPLVMKNNGVPMDITGYSFVASLTNAIDNTIVFTSNGVLTDPTNGLVTFFFDSNVIPVGVYDMKVKTTNNQGVVTTSSSSSINITN